MLLILFLLFSLFPYSKYISIWYYQSSFHRYQSMVTLINVIDDRWFLLLLLAKVIFLLLWGSQPSHFLAVSDDLLVFSVIPGSHSRGTKIFFSCSFWVIFGFSTRIYLCTWSDNPMGQYENGPLEFHLLWIISYPWWTTNNTVPFLPVKSNEFSDECEAWEKNKNGPYQRGDYMVTPMAKKTHTQNTQKKNIQTWYAQQKHNISRWQWWIFWTIMWLQRNQKSKQNKNEIYVQYTRPVHIRNGFLYLKYQNGKDPKTKKKWWNKNKSKNITILHNIFVCHKYHIAGNTFFLHNNGNRSSINVIFYILPPFLFYIPPPLHPLSLVLLPLSS